MKLKKKTKNPPRWKVGERVTVSFTAKLVDVSRTNSLVLPPPTIIHDGQHLIVPFRFLKKKPTPRRRRR